MATPTVTVTFSLMDAVDMVEALKDKAETARHNYKTYQSDRLERNWYGSYADEALINFTKYARILSDSFGVTVAPIELIEPNPLPEPEPEPETPELAVVPNAPLPHVDDNN